jgi:hypothetical protein
LRTNRHTLGKIHIGKVLALKKYLCRLLGRAGLQYILARLFYPSPNRQ